MRTARTTAAVLIADDTDTAPRPEARPGTPHRVRLRVVRRDAAARAVNIAVRQATPADATAIHTLIADHLDEGRLLPRDRDEIARHAHRFAVATDGDRVVACAELAPLSTAVAEVRSLVVDATVRSHGIGRRLLDELVRGAVTSGFERLCAFTHTPGFFLRVGFSIVPHPWLPEKIQRDCQSCAQFRHCGQHAVMLSLVRSRHAGVPNGSLNG